MTFQCQCGRSVLLLPHVPSQCACGAIYRYSITTSNMSETWLSDGAIPPVHPNCKCSLAPMREEVPQAFYDAFDKEELQP